MDADEYTALGGRLDMAQIDGWYGRFEDIEIDPTFLCLTDLYAAAAPLVPADWTVVDLGGYVGVQPGLLAMRTQGRQETARRAHLGMPELRHTARP